MLEQIYVIGHKNADMDSVCSAIAYARLRQLQGELAFVPAMHGKVRPEVRYVLSRFGVPDPLQLSDIGLRARDVMTNSTISVRQEQTILETGRLLQELNKRAVPVVGEDGKVVGMISVDNFAKLFFDELDPQTTERVTLDIDSIVSVLQGRVLVKGTQQKLGYHVLVGAMQADSMATYIQEGSLVVLGDRDDAQVTAITKGAGALVVTGNHPVSEEILHLAREHGVTIISTHNHSYTTVRLINLSIAVSHIMNQQFASCRPEAPLSIVQKQLQKHRVLPVLDEENRLVGIISRSNLISPPVRGIILVDHNERSQAIDGLEDAEVLGIIDHHRIADVHTTKPILFRADSVGCTATIIAGLYREDNVPIAPDTAALLLAALLYDTLVLRSPTCTERDRKMAAHLAHLAGLDSEQYGKELFTAGSDLSGRSAEELLRMDFKEFSEGKLRYGIGSIETASPVAVLDRSADLLAAMSETRQKEGYESLMLMIVDILQLTGTLLVVGHEAAVAEAAGYPLEADGHTIVVPGMVSRKKQLVPLLPKIGAVIAAN